MRGNVLTVQNIGENEKGLFLLGLVPSFILQLVEIPTFLCASSLKKVPFSDGASPYSPLQGVPPPGIYGEGGQGCCRETTKATVKSKKTTANWREGSFFFFKFGSDLVIFGNMRTCFSMKLLYIVFKVISQVQRSRLREVPNFGDSGEIHARARENGLPRGDAPRGEAPTRLYFAESPKLETTRSLQVQTLLLFQ